jgi:hypothetical protein
MAEVGGVLPVRRLELRRSQAKIFSNPKKNFAGFGCEERQRMEML